MQYFWSVVYIRIKISKFRDPETITQEGKDIELVFRNVSFPSELGSYPSNGTGLETIRGDLHFPDIHTYTPSSCQVNVFAVWESA